MREVLILCVKSLKQLNYVWIKEVADMPEKRIRLELGGLIIAAILLLPGSYAGVTGTKGLPKMTVRKIESIQGKEAAHSDTENYSQELAVLSALVGAEVGDLSDDCQIAAASVVLNRINSPAFPDTVYDVVYQPGQYETVDNGKIENHPDDNVRKNVEYVLQNGSQIPENVVYQGMFSQGSGVWDIIDGEYFCYE